MPNMNTNHLVLNLNGTARKRCKCGSWLEHWYNATRSARSICATWGCSGDAEVGAHVRDQDNRSGHEHWIVPLCRGCNNKTEDFFVKNGVFLVPANKAITGCF